MIGKTEKMLFLIVEVFIIYAAFGAFLDYETSAYDTSFLVLAGMFLVVIFKNKVLNLGRYQQIIFSLFIIILLVVLVKLMLFYDYKVYKDAITLVGSLMLLLICNYWKPDKGLLYIFVVIAFVAGIVFIYAYNINKTIWWGGTITILKNNPQSVGAWSYILGCYQFLMFDLTRNKIIKLINIFCIGYYIYISLITGMRAVLVMLPLIIILKILPKMSFLIKWYWCFGLTFMPGIITLLGAFLWSHYQVDLLNGRFRIWSEMLHNISIQVIVGDLKKYGDIYTHSAFLDVVLQFGIIIAVLLFLLIGCSMYRRVKNGVSRMGYDAYLLLCGILLTSCDEGGVLLTGFGGVWFLTYSLLFYIEAGYGVETNRIRFPIHIYVRSQKAMQNIGVDDLMNP